MEKFEPEQVEVIIQALRIYSALKPWMQDIYYESAFMAMNDEDISLEKRWQIRRVFMVIEAEKIVCGRDGGHA